MYNIARSILCAYPVSVVISSEPLPDGDLLYFCLFCAFVYLCPHPPVSNPLAQRPSSIF